jgi:DNA polymerase-3 subunit alpha
LQITPPHPVVSDRQWRRHKGALVAGFSQVPGIGLKTADAIVEHRNGSQTYSWDDMLAVSGIGNVTMGKIKEFAEQGDDPFGALWLDRAVAEVKRAISAGELGSLPKPTHVAEDLPYERGDDIEVVWLGTIYTRNERDLFEFNQAKGAELDLSNPDRPLLNGKPIKDPHLDKWVVMVGHDESEQIGLRVDRWKYPRLREKVWKIRPGRDLVLLRGIKPHYMPTRQLNISEIWIIDPEI